MIVDHAEPIMRLLMCYQDVEDLRTKLCDASNRLINVWCEESISREEQEKKHAEIQKEVAQYDRYLMNELGVLKKLKEKIG